jgi:hypothetical protein
MVVGVAGDFPFRHCAGLAVDDAEALLVGEVDEYPRSTLLELKGLGMASELEVLDALHAHRVDHAHRRALVLAITHIDELGRGVVADVVGVGPGAKVKGLEERERPGIVGAQLARLARDQDPVGARNVERTLRVLQAGDRMYPVPGVDDLHRIVAQGVDDEILASAVPPVVIHAPIHAR